MAAIEYADIVGRRLEYFRLGIPDNGKPTLVFLHEGLGSASTWKDFPRQLATATGLPGVVYSRFGYGQSDVPAGPRNAQFMHQEALQYLPAFLDTVGVDNSILVGHSDGGSIALIHAAGNASVTALLLLSPHVFMEKRCIENTRKLKIAYTQGKLKENLARHHADIDYTFNSWIDTVLDPEFENWNIEEYLPQISCPVLHVQGRDDEFWTDIQAETVKAGVAGPVDVLLLKQCGHSPHRDQPELTLSAMSGFLRKFDLG